MKFCFIKRVPFKTPEPKCRIVWANVIAENQGLALVLVPKANRDGTHTVYFAEENLDERIYQAVTPYCMELENEAVEGAGQKLRILGKSFSATDFRVRFRDRRDEF
jgi:hypothetical protein